MKARYHFQADSTFLKYFEIQWKEILYFEETRFKDEIIQNE
jgi:hypothetical protein